MCTEGRSIRDDTSLSARASDAQLWFEDIVVLADVVADRALSGICEDPDDDKYVAAALDVLAS